MKSGAESGSVARVEEPADDPEPAARYVASAALFLRLVGACFAVAFASLSSQVTGLVGARGIQPAHEFLTAAARLGGARAFFAAPTVFWLSDSDAALKAACVVGGAAAAGVVAGVLQAPLLLVCWALYLSLCTVGGVFLGFQWDALLLEAGFLAVFLAPWTWRPGAWRTRSPSPWALWLLRFLLLRLMLGSGAVKLASGDASWRDLTALQAHYETQPLPTWVGYFAHQLPAWVQRVSCVALLGVELVVPAFVFLPRTLRHAAGVAFLGLMLVLGLTGNDAFFGLLTAGLAVLLFDDDLYPRWVRERVKGAPPAVERRWVPWLAAPFVAAWLMLSANELLRSMGGHAALPGFVTTAHRWVAPWRTINRYGLFAVMTTTRPEITIEGSDDRVHWRDYSFRFKPQYPGARPRFVEPFQPRLDWQLWFAALGTCEENDWFVALLRRLTEDSPDVVALFADNPFPEHGPRYVRATLWDYRFTDLAKWRATGLWWERTEVAPYCPVLARPGG